MATQLVDTLSQFTQGNLGKTLLSYLVKGSLASGATTIFLTQARQKVSTGLRGALAQVLFFSALLFLIDYVVPRVLPGLGASPVEKVAEARQAVAEANFEEDS